MLCARWKQSGFTLVELLVGIVMIGIISGIAVFALNGFGSASGDATCRAELNSLRSAEDNAFAVTGGYLTESNLVTQKYLIAPVDCYDVTAPGGGPLVNGATTYALLKVGDGTSQTVGGGSPPTSTIGSTSTTTTSSTTTTTSSTTTTTTTAPAALAIDRCPPANGQGQRRVVTGTASGTSTVNVSLNGASQGSVSVTNGSWTWTTPQLTNKVSYTVDVSFGSLTASCTWTQ